MDTNGFIKLEVGFEFNYCGTKRFIYYIDMEDDEYPYETFPAIYKEKLEKINIFSKEYEELVDNFRMCMSESEILKAIIYAQNREHKNVMTDNIKFWLKQLYANEIEEASAAASNEHLWALGSDDSEMANLHEANAEEQRVYIEILRSLMEEIK